MPSSPLDQSSLLIAADWLQTALLGSTATALAVVCVGLLGIVTLSGRLPLRRGLEIVLGCFLLFGAPTVAAGLRSLTGQTSEAVVVPAQLLSESPAKVVRPSPVPYDPYAGASMHQPQ